MHAHSKKKRGENPPPPRSQADISIGGSFSSLLDVHAFLMYHWRVRCIFRIFIRIWHFIIDNLRMQFSEIFMAIILKKTFREQIYGEMGQQTEKSNMHWAERKKRCQWFNIMCGINSNNSELTFLILYTWKQGGQWVIVCYRKKMNSNKM